ncbi:hypothetical protein QOT17_021699 [Balamuthia mandrillaris]
MQLDQNRTFFNHNCSEEPGPLGPTNLSRYHHVYLPERWQGSNPEGVLGFTTRFRLREQGQEPPPGEPPIEWSSRRFRKGRPLKMKRKVKYWGWKLDSLSWWVALTFFLACIPLVFGPLMGSIPPITAEHKDRRLYLSSVPLFVSLWGFLLSILLEWVEVVRVSPVLDEQMFNPAAVKRDLRDGYDEEVGKVVGLRNPDERRRREAGLNVVQEVGLDEEKAGEEGREVRRADKRRRAEGTTAAMERGGEEQTDREQNRRQRMRERALAGVSWRRAPLQRTWRLLARLDFWGTTILLLSIVSILVSGFGLLCQFKDNSLIEHLLVSGPATVGSAGFILGNYIFFIESMHRFVAWKPRSLVWWMLVMRIIGAILFVAGSAFRFAPSASPITGYPANIVLTVGALFFFVSAYLQILEQFNG